MSSVSSVQSYGSSLSRLTEQLASTIKAKAAETGEPDARGTPPERSAETPPPRETAGAADQAEPASVKDRIDGLVASQVASGGLTSDQADALKGAFAPIGSTEPGSTGTPPREQRPGDVTTSGSPAQDRPAATRPDADTDSGTALRAFLERVRNTQPATYSARGTTAGPTRPLVVDLST